MAIWQKSKMTDSHKSFWKGMQQKPSDKFNRRYGAGHSPLGIAVFVLKGNHPISYRDDSVIWYGHPVGVTAKILKHVFRAFNRLLDIDHPLFGIKGFFKLLKSLRPFKRRSDPWEFQFSVLVGFGHIIKKLSPESLRKRFYIKEICMLAWFPRIIRFQYSAGDQAVKMKMHIEMLIPGV